MAITYHTKPDLYKVKIDGYLLPVCLFSSTPRFTRGYSLWTKLTMDKVEVREMILQEVNDIIIPRSLISEPVNPLGIGNLVNDRCGGFQMLGEGRIVVVDRIEQLEERSTENRFVNETGTELVDCINHNFIRLISSNVSRSKLVNGTEIQSKLFWHGGCREWRNPFIAVC
jgi:hypothetical protein